MTLSPGMAAKTSTASVCCLDEVYRLSRLLIVSSFVSCSHRMDGSMTLSRILSVGMFFGRGVSTRIPSISGTPVPTSSLPAPTWPGPTYTTNINLPLFGFRLSP